MTTDYRRQTDGLHIALIGPDGAGKSTLMDGAELHRLLFTPKHPVIVTALPTGNDIGKLARDYTRNASSATDHQIAALLHAADKTDHYNSYILRHLLKGCTVISDRWVECSGAYKGVTPDLFQFVLDINRNVPGPDVSVYLYANNVDTLVARAANGHDNGHATRDYLMAIQDRYFRQRDVMLSRRAQAHPENPTWRIDVAVDGLTTNGIAQIVAKHLYELFPTYFNYNPKDFPNA